jgi:hypothetical protein
MIASQVAPTGHAAYQPYVTFPEQVASVNSPFAHKAAPLDGGIQFEFAFARQFDSVPLKVK